MNNLASLKSQLLVQYTEDSQWTHRNFYQHHNMPIRSLIRTSQAKDHPKKTQQSSRVIQKSNSASLKPIGRNIFNDQQKAMIPGPGQYSQSPPKYSSHCYIKKQEQYVLAKISKRLKKRQLITDCRGPGMYNPQKAFNSTSKSKGAVYGTIPQCQFTRSIFPTRKLDGLFLTSSLSDKNLYIGDVPPPTVYQTKLAFKHSQSHKISITRRSSLVKEDMAPGPGTYSWQTYYQGKDKYGTKNKKKPSVEYKFVYGHPS